MYDIYMIYLYNVNFYNFFNQRLPSVLDKSTVVCMLCWKINQKQKCRLQDYSTAKGLYATLFTAFSFVFEINRLSEGLVVHVQFEHTKMIVFND